MKKMIICVGLSLLGLIIWTYFGAAELIVCRLASTESLNNDWELLHINREIDQLDGLWFISDSSFGWKGLGEACLAPGLFLILAGSFSGYCLWKWKEEKITRHCRDLSENLLWEAEYNKLLEKDLDSREMSLKDEYKKLHLAKEQFKISKEKSRKEIYDLRVDLGNHRCNAEHLEQLLENERRDHVNRKDKIVNLEKKIKKLETEKIANDREKLSLERENFDLHKKKAELETKISRLAGKKN